MTFGEKLKEIRTNRNLTQEELAKILKTSKQVISRYENNQRTPKISIANEYATILGVQLNYLVDDNCENTPMLYGVSNIIPLPQRKNIPLLGTIACGEPILATENIDGFVSADENITADFALKCKGDSMINARIFDGDIVYIRQQADVENGEIAAVLIGEDATLKRVHKYENKIVLSPANPMYDDLIYSGERLNEIKILGKAVAFTSIVR